MVGWHHGLNGHELEQTPGVVSLQTGEQQWVQLRASGRGYSLVCLEGSTICCALVAVA